MPGSQVVRGDHAPGRTAGQLDGGHTLQHRAEDLASLVAVSTSTGEDTPEELIALWSSAVHRSELLLEDALADGGLDRAAARSWPGEPPPSLRWIMLHMIEEYARHNGHADLLREAYDGETGE